MNITGWAHFGIWALIGMNRGNPLHSCMVITKSCHSCSICHSDQFNTQPPSSTTSVVVHRIIYTFFWNSIRPTCMLLFKKSWIDLNSSKDGQNLEKLYIMVFNAYTSPVTKFLAAYKYLWYSSIIFDSCYKLLPRYLHWWNFQWSLWYRWIKLYQPMQCAEESLWTGQWPVGCSRQWGLLWW